MRLSTAARWAKTAAFVTVASLVVATAFVYVVLQFIGVRFYTVESNSMAPGFARGDVIAAKVIAPHEVETGDVILFQQTGFSAPTAHRVTRISSQPDIISKFVTPKGDLLKESVSHGARTFWTKGDANAAEDRNPVSGDQVLGRQMFVVPWPLNLLATRFDRETLFLIGAAGLLVYIAWEATETARLVLRRRKQGMDQAPAETMEGA